VKLTPHLLPVPSLRMIAAKTPFPNMSSWLAQENFANILKRIQ